MQKHAAKTHTTLRCSFGHVPENPLDFWPALAARLVDLWQRGGHVEVPLLQQAAHAYETALSLTPSASEVSHCPVGKTRLTYL